MVDSYDFYGDTEYFSSVKSRIVKYLTEDLKAEVIRDDVKGFLSYSKEGQDIGILRFKEQLPDKFVEYYQHGLKRMVVSWDGSGAVDTQTLDFISKLSLIFSPQEEVRLRRYTAELDRIISKEYLNQPLLEDVLVIFREHSLISVLNVFKVLTGMGLRPENTVYYSKGDRCRNIDRIEESFKNKGYSTYVLSPFESVSETGKTEDEVIIPDSAERVRNELKPHLERAKRRI